MEDLEKALENIGTLTHLGNAERLAKEYDGKLKYNHLLGKWFLWTGIIWEENKDDLIFRLIAKEAKKLYFQAQIIENKEIQKKVQAWARTSENFNTMRSTEQIARGLIEFSNIGGWDEKPFLFACKKGVIDLKTGEINGGNATDMLTIQSPIDYDEKAEAPLWNKFIDEAFDSNYEIMHYIQKALGYSLTGDNKEQVIFIGYGTGSNGKSTLLRILLQILGDYGYTAPRTTFQVNKYNDQTNDIAQLVAKRFVAWSETRMSSSLDEEKLKALTGGENQRARFLHHEFFEFQPILKLWMFFNHKPVARDDSQGFWRRIRIIPFNHVFDGKDKDIDKKLGKELPGILRWLVEGCLMWQQEGLDEIPEAIIEATRLYQEESDPLAQWLNEMCTFNEQVSTQSTELYKSYFNWAKTQGFIEKEILTNTMFGKRMTAKFEKIHTMSGWFYKRIGLINPS